MGTFTVTAAAKKKDVPDNGYGPMQVIALTLDDGASPPVIAEWFTKAATPIPAAGSKIDGNLEDGKFGPQFKKASGGGFGGAGGGGRPRDPAERRSIEMQHAQKCAVEALKLAAAHGDYRPPSAADVITHVKTLAKVLYDQCEEAAS